MQEDSTKGRDHAQGGQYKKGAWGEGGLVQEDITEGMDGAEGGHYKREG